MDLDWHLTNGHRPGEEYVQYAQVYDALFGDLRDDAQFYIRVAREVAPDGAVLEIGSGTGRLARELLAGGHTVLGIDASAEMLAVAASKLSEFAPRYEGRLLDVRTMTLAERFSLAVAPYGMVAHLLTDADRLAAYRTVFAHLLPGGSFVFDDMPGWLAGAADSTQLELRRTGVDEVTGLPVRMMANSIDVAGQPFTVRYDFIDWLRGEEVAKRVVVRVIFRNIALADELRLLDEAGFVDVQLFGGFDGKPFDREHLAENGRLIFRCRKPA